MIRVDYAGPGGACEGLRTLGLEPVGIELSERYCEIAAKRLAQGVLDFGASA